MFNSIFLSTNALHQINGLEYKFWGVPLKYIYIYIYIQLHILYSPTTTLDTCNHTSLYKRKENHLVRGLALYLILLRLWPSQGHSLTLLRILSQGHSLEAPFQGLSLTLLGTLFDSPEDTLSMTFFDHLKDTL